MKEFKDFSIDINQNNLKTGDQVVPDALSLVINEFYFSYFKKDLQEGFLQESDISRKIEGEKSFYLRTLGNIIRAIQDNKGKECVALFDIDETLAKAKFTEAGLEHIIRPTALSLFEFIKSKGAHNGFLTSRGLEAIKGQLENEFKNLKPFIDQNYLFSSRELRVLPFEESEIEKSLPETMKNTFVSGDYNKIKFLKQLELKNKPKNKIFIPVDDFKYPALFPYGVALEEKEKFYL